MEERLVLFARGEWSWEDRGFQYSGTAVHETGSSRNESSGGENLEGLEKGREGGGKRRRGRGRRRGRVRMKREREETWRGRGKGKRKDKMIERK